MCSDFITLNTGQKMPIIGLGTAELSTMREALCAALECGYRAVDTAYIYMTEEAIGDELQDWFSKGKLKREDVFVTSKLPAIGNRAEDVDKFLTLSLQDLKLDYLDLYLIHHPFGLQCLPDNRFHPKNPDGDDLLFDHDTDFESLWRALEKEVEGGRVKAIGLSNFNSLQIDRILKFAKIPPAVNQVEMHCYLPQQNLLEFCKQRGIVLTAYSPLGAPYTPEGKIPPVLLEHSTVLEISKKHGKTAAHVLLRFLVQQNVTLVPRATARERIVSNFQIMDFTLTEEEIQKLLKLDRGKEGRVYHFREDFPGCPKHKEYPFHAEF